MNPRTIFGYLIAAIGIALIPTVWLTELFIPWTAKLIPFSDSHATPLVPLLV